MICADKHHAEVYLLEANVHMQHILLCAPWHTNRGPCLSLLHGRICHYEIENDLHI